MVCSGQLLGVQRRSNFVCVSCAASDTLADSSAIKKPVEDAIKSSIARAFTRPIQNSIAKSVANAVACANAQTHDRIAVSFTLQGANKNLRWAYSDSFPNEQDVHSRTNWISPTEHAPLQAGF